MKTIEALFEKGVRLLCQHMGDTSEMSKPTLFHSIRVGTFLYEQEYPKEIVLAGLLHDIIEDTDISPQLLENEFGADVVELITTNSKDSSISDQDERIDELIKRCVENGEASLIVKSADVIDNFKYFSRINDEIGIDYCVRNAKTIFKHKPDDFTDRIFNELDKKLQKTMK
jgi:(p)ppGpp synthase/HD superfamily hydrolase